jgi:serine/threonine-protein kinase
LEKGIFEARADGSSQPQLLIGSNAYRVPSSFTADGKHLAYEETDDGRNQIWTVSLEEEGGWLKAGRPEAFFTSNSDDDRPSFSPDGRWLAYDSDESGKEEVYVRPFPPSAAPGRRWQISNNGGQSPEWSRDGHDLLYRSGVQLMVVKYTVQGDTFAAGKPRVWISKMGTAVRDWDLAPDGKRVLATVQDGPVDGAKPEHEVVFLDNFFDYLRLRAPMGK